MQQIRDLNNKRVYDLSEDKKTANIRGGNCVTRITIDAEGKRKRFKGPC